MTSMWTLLLLGCAAGLLSAQTAGEKKKVIFIAGKPSHSYGAHEHNAGSLLLAKELQAAMPNVSCDVHLNGWPADECTTDRR